MDNDNLPQQQGHHLIGNQIKTIPKQENLEKNLTNGIDTEEIEENLEEEAITTESKKGLIQEQYPKKDQISSSLASVNENENEEEEDLGEGEEGKSKNKELLESFTSGDSSLALIKEQLKFCSNILRGLKRHPQSNPFQTPVDAIALNIPDYPKVITHPMDLSTIAKKFDSFEYSTPDIFITDVRLIFENCYKYNGPDSQISSMAKSMEKYFNNQVLKIPTTLAPSSDEQSSSTHKRRNSGTPTTPISASRPRRDSQAVSRQSLTPTTAPTSFSKSTKKSSIDTNFCHATYRELTKKSNQHIVWPFLQPVDPMALGIPDYLEVIKEPMDLSSIKKKLDSGTYSNGDQFASDIRLMLNNCFIYNAPDTDVFRLGKELEAVFEQKWSQRSTSINSASAATTPTTTMVASTASSMVASNASNSNIHHNRPSSHDFTMGGGGDSDSDSERIIALNQKIQNLQQELNELLMRRKNKTKSSSKSKNRTQRASSGSSIPQHHQHQHHIPLDLTPMTYEEKKNLSESVNQLSAEELTHVVEIIHRSMPNLKSSNGDSEVIELDIESLDVSVLRELQAFVNKCNNKKRKLSEPSNVKKKTASTNNLPSSLSSNNPNNFSSMSGINSNSNNAHAHTSNVSGNSGNNTVTNPNALGNSSNINNTMNHSSNTNYPNNLQSPEPTQSKSLSSDDDSSSSDDDI